MVLGIKNRTENWKTARGLAPFFGAGAVQLAQKLAPDLAVDPQQVKLELYWKGMRDHFAERSAGRAPKERKEQKKQEKRRIQELYKERFGDLQAKVGRFMHDGRKFQTLEKECNYNGDKADKLFDNLYHTEIDIVLETPGHLFIGEAKYKTGFHASSKLVLVHQLIRQYVMATILLDLRNAPREVVPFIVTDTQEGQKRYPRPLQVAFLLKQGWLKECHLLSWCCIDKLASSQP